MKNQSGFTLVELIIVIVIIGLLAGVAVPRFVDLSSGAEALTCKGNQATAQAAVAISFSESAIAGNPKLPDKLKKGMFKENAVPTCPYAPWDAKKNKRENKKKLKYDKNTGTASCPNSIPIHARY